MKKQLLLILVVVLSVFLLFHVNQWMKNEYKIWTAIENREWEARGTGVYFYEFEASETSEKHKWVLNLRAK